MEVFQAQDEKFLQIEDIDMKSDARILNRRKNVAVRLSYDEGETWTEAKSIEPGISGYSDLAVGPDGSIYSFYQRGCVDTSHYRPAHLTIARFNLQWLTNSTDRFG
ncbi:MAG: exo-alpha-sialidase [Phycisphaerales bacterium]|nr:MAG: exo-alpha-sialidase [Phycisphaerales bacterium]UCF14967.1 MAG: exo-alpha-sialidase [Phycisphaerales bacterium]